MKFVLVALSILSLLLVLSLVYAGIGILLSSARDTAVAVVVWPSGREIGVPASTVAACFLAMVLVNIGFLLLRFASEQAREVDVWATLGRIFDPLAMAVLGIVILGAIAVFRWKFPPLSAAVVVALASGSVLATWLLASLLWRGETIEIESRWGGLGGDLGGFRLSRTASLALVALALVVGCVAAVRPPEGPADGAGKPAASGSAGSSPDKDKPAAGAE